MTVDNILATYYLSVESERLAGKTWYFTAHDLAERLADKYCTTIEIAASVIATLSPRCPWDRNLIDAEVVLAAIYHGLPVSQIKVSTFGKNKLKAYAIAAGTVACSEIQALKTSNFARTILGPDTHMGVVIDVHAFSVWCGSRQKARGLSERQYEVISDDYIVASKCLNLLPSQLQAITWVCHRRLIGIE